MRIAHLIDLLHVGGAEKLQVTFAAAARSRGIDTSVISLRNVEDTLIPGQLRALGAQVWTFPAPYLFDLRRISRLVRLLRRERFAVLHTHLTYANIIGALVGRLADIPVVATLHSAGFDPIHGSRIPRIESLALHYGAWRVIAVGHAVAAAHRARLGDRRLDVIPNAVAAPPTITAEERAALRAELVGDPGYPLLISVGRLTPLKGYPDLLAAFHRLREQHPTARLAIAGGGELHGELSEQIAARGLTGRAMLLGSREDVPRLLAAADLYISASHLEGMPLAILEAMAAGLPVVATDVGDVARVVVEGTGMVVPARQPAALAAAVSVLLDDPAKMRGLGAAAHTHVIANYGLSAWMDQLLALYGEAISPCGRKSERV